MLKCGMTPRKFFHCVSVFCFALLLLLGLGPGCSRSASTPVSPEKAASQMLAWNLKTTVDAYDKAGTKSLVWDDSAKRCLTAFAHARAKDLPNESWDEIVSTNAAAAVDAGCTDPLIMYLYIRTVLPQTNSKVEFAKRFYATANAMNASAYPMVRKFYATMRANEQYYNSYDTLKDLEKRDEATGLLTTLLGQVEILLDDKTIPPREAAEAAQQALDLAGRTDFHNKTMFYDAIQKSLMKNFPDGYLTWYLKGSHYIELAWNDRGGGYADTVSKEGWEGFKTNLVVAREALEHAWKLNPKEANIAVQMLWVNLGQGGSREEMDLWFNRVMELDPNNYNACSCKENYLEPKYYGTEEEALAFGRECVQSTKWGGYVPLTLVLVHNDINSRIQGAAKTNYWKQPEVWTDIKNAYDRFFELNPSETYVYNAYALHAYQAGQWDALNEILPKLTATNYDMFGGQAEFDKMIRLAKAHASN
jgi:tetratricopeptide (TPR) repeat protein